MSDTVWIAAFVLALAGGGHCAGMCGGIVSALSLSSVARSSPVRLTLAYHAGRACSYVAAGALAGAVGEAGLAIRGSLVTHQALYASASVAMMAAGLYVAGYARFVRGVEAVGRSLWRRVEPWSRPLIPVTTPARAGALGALWGWLPCGMVYGALLLALGTGSVAGGMLTMGAFALGTLPSLLMVGLFAHRARQGARAGLRRLAGLLLAALGIYGLAQLGLHAASLSDFCVLPMPASR